MTHLCAVRFTPQPPLACCTVAWTAWPSAQCVVCWPQVSGYVLMKTTVCLSCVLLLLFKTSVSALWGHKLIEMSWLCGAVCRRTSIEQHGPVVMTDCHFWSSSCIFFFCLVAKCQWVPPAGIFPYDTSAASSCQSSIAVTHSFTDARWMIIRTSCWCESKSVWWQHLV